MKVEVNVLGSPSLISLMVSVDVKPHERKKKRSEEKEKKMYNTKEKKNRLPS